MSKSKYNLSGVGFLLKIKKRSKGKGYNPSHFFQKFLEKAIIELKANSVAVSVNNDNFKKVLIDEIQKKIGFGKQKKKELNRTVNDEQKQIYNYFVNLPPRNIDTIIFCLRKLEKFNEFIKFNNISFEQLEKISAYIKYQFVPKGQLLFSIGKRAKKFFCIINGCISLRTIDPNRIQELERIKSLNKQNDDIEIKEEKKIKSLRDFGIETEHNKDEEEKENKIKEYEIRKYTQGMCLCEWELIRKRIFIENAYALEDTILFYLEKEYFDKFLSSNIVRSDIERKYFIIAKIPLLTLENLILVQPEFYNKDDIIYTEFDKAFEAILIYKGSGALATFQNAINKNDILSRRKELKIIAKIEKGGLAGLEIGKIRNEDEEIFYDNNLIVTDDNTIIFRLNIDILKGKSKKLERHLNKFFNELYTQQNYFINNLKNQSEKMIKLSKKNMDEQIRKNINTLFDSLINPKVELKQNRLEKIKTHININKTLTVNNLKNETNKFKNKNHRNRTLTTEFKQNSKSIEQNNKIILSNNEKKSRKKLNLKVTCNKLILKRNYNNDDIIKNPIETFNTKTNYHNYFKNIEIRKEIKKEPFAESKNIIVSNNRFNSLKNNNQNYKIRKKYFDNNKKYLQNYLPNIKYFYDSGKFKIPLLSLE